MGHITIHVMDACECAGGPVLGIVFLCGLCAGKSCLNCVGHRRNEKGRLEQLCCPRCGHDFEYAKEPLGISVYAKLKEMQR